MTLKEQDEALLRALARIVDGVLVESSHDTPTSTIVAEHIWNAGWRPVAVPTPHTSTPSEAMIGRLQACNCKGCADQLDSLKGI